MKPVNIQQLHFTNILIFLKKDLSDKTLWTGQEKEYKGPELWGGHATWYK